VNNRAGMLIYFQVSDNPSTFPNHQTNVKFQPEITAILKSKRSDSDMTDVMEALSYTQADFQKGFDIALEMENRNLAKLIYSNFNATKIIIEFTLLANEK
jgi:hypothetical protein